MQIGTVSTHSHQLRDQLLAELTEVNTALYNGLLFDCVNNQLIVAYVYKRFGQLRMSVEKGI